MLSFSSVQRIFLSRSTTDMRKQANGLSQQVVDALAQDPLSGDAYVFLNRRRTIVKILVWDVSGYWVACKRLELGCFAGRRWLGADGGSAQLSASELMAMLEGVDVRQAVYHQQYSVAPTRRGGIAKDACSI